MNKIGFLGSGNMAAAMIDGLLAQTPAERSNLICFSASGKTSGALAERAGIAQITTLARDFDRVAHGAAGDHDLAAHAARRRDG